MPISGATLLSGATLSATGGTAKTFSTVGETIANGKKVTDLSVADARVRPTVTCINRPSSLSALGVYSKAKRTIKLVIPRVNTAGVVQFPLLEIRLEDYPEMSAAEVTALVNYGAQLLFDADFANFIANGALD